MIDVHHIEQISQDCSLTEFVGTTVLDTIGLVIPGIDPSLLEKMNLKKAYKSLGLISSRTGAAGQINAADEAVKSTNTEIVSIELPRDTKGWGGHGCFIVIGGDNVSDVRRAVNIALEYIGKYAGELYISQAGQGLEEFKHALLEIIRKEQIYIERLYDFSEAGKIQLIRSKGQLLSEEYVPEGIEVKAYVPQDIYGRL